MSALTARTAYGNELIEKKVVYIDGQLFFNYELLEDIRIEAKTGPEQGKKPNTISPAAMYRILTPSPRGRINWFHVDLSAQVLRLHTFRGDYPLPLATTELNAMGFDDVFWSADSGRKPFPRDVQRLKPYGGILPGIQVEGFARQFERNSQNYALLDNRIVQWIDFPPRGPITIGFFNTYEDMMQVPTVSLERKFRLNKGGQMIHFSSNNEDLLHWADHELASAGPRGETW